MTMTLIIASVAVFSHVLGYYLGLKHASEDYQMHLKTLKNYLKGDDK